MITHIAMYVRELEEARDFFIKYFDAKSNDGYYNGATGFRSFFLTFADGPRLELMNRPMPQEAYGDAFHIAFSVGSNEKVNELTHKLKDAGYTVISGPRTTGDGYYESCVTVFDNLRIEITV